MRAVALLLLALSLPPSHSIEARIDSIDLSGCSAEASSLCPQLSKDLASIQLGKCLVRRVLAGGLSYGDDKSFASENSVAISPSCGESFKHVPEPLHFDMESSVSLRKYCTPEMIECGVKFIPKQQRQRGKRKNSEPLPVVIANCVLGELASEMGGTANIDRAKHCVEEAKHVINQYRAQLMDPDVQQDCKEDAITLCENRAYSALDTHLCLIENVDKVSQACFKHKSKLESLTMYKESGKQNIPFWESCELEIGTYCEGFDSTPDGWERCLKAGHFGKEFSLSLPCRESLARGVALDSFDPELNESIDIACRVVIEQECSPPDNMIFNNNAGSPRLSSATSGLNWSVASKRASKLHNSRGRWIGYCLMEKQGYIKSKPEYKSCAQELVQSTIITNAAWTSWSEWNTTAVCQKEAMQLCSELLNDGNFHLSTEVHHCLRDPKHITLLSNECTTLQHKLMFKEADELMLKPRLAFRCAWAVSHFCRHSDVESPYACLQRFQYHDEMPESCRTELSRDEDTFSSLTLSTRCEQDVKTLCPGVHGGVMDFGNRAIDCLFDHVHDVQDRVCRLAILRSVEISIDDITSNSALFDYCHEDIKSVCASFIKDDLSTRKGTKQALQCLFRLQRRVKNPINLSQGCQKSVVLFRKASTPTVPLLRRACSGLLVEQCDAKLDPTTMSVLPWLVDKNEVDPRFAASPLGSCLFDVMLDPTRSAGASEDCRREFHEESFLDDEDRVLNQETKVACKVEIQTLCDEQLSMHEIEKIQVCLVDKFEAIQDAACRGKVVQIIKTWSGLTDNSQKFDRSCDIDVSQFCKSNELSSLGSIHKCLRDNLKFLRPPCRDLELRKMKSEANLKYLKPRIAEACSMEVAVLCSDVAKLPGTDGLPRLAGKKGHTPPRATTTMGSDKSEGVAKCLASKVDDPSMSSVCRATVKSENSSLNQEAEYESEQGCDEDAKKLGCKSSSLLEENKCLRENNSKISAVCAKSQERAMKQERFRNSMPVELARMCVMEIRMFCPNEEHQLACLADQHVSHQYSLGCRAEVKRFLWSQFSVIGDESDIARDCEDMLAGICKASKQNPLDSHSQFSCLLNHLRPVLSLISNENSERASNVNEEKRRTPSASELTCLNSFAAFTDLALRYYTPRADITMPCDRVVKASCSHVDPRQVQDCLYRSVMVRSPDTGTPRPKRNTRPCVMLLKVGALYSNHEFTTSDESEYDTSLLTARVIPATEAPTKRVRKPTSREVKQWQRERVGGESVLNSLVSESSNQPSRSSVLPNTSFTWPLTFLGLAFLFVAVNQHYTRRRNAGKKIPRSKH